LRKRARERVDCRAADLGIGADKVVMVMDVETRVDVQALLNAYLPAAALGAALELKLFWRLQDGPRSLESLAQELQIPVQRCEYWLRLLVALNLLERKGACYALTPVARSAILDTHDADTWKMLAIDAQDNYPYGQGLAQRLRQVKGSDDDARGGRLAPYVQKMSADLQRARLFTRMLFDLHEPLADVIATTLDLEGARRLMDLGGGSGVVALRLLREEPQLQAVVVDIDNVCVAGREIAATTPVVDRIAYHAANFFSDPLPGGFDVITQCDLGIFDAELWTRAAGALNPGGRLVIVDRWFEQAAYDTPGRLNYLLRKSLDDPTFALKTLAEIEAMLRAAGLEPEPVVDLSFNRWQLIAARKRA
jgi:SAM-dependent methyltransferase